MSMLRYLAPGGGKGKLHPPTRGNQAPARDEGKPKAKLHVPNYGIIYLPPPDIPQPDGTESREPRNDAVMHGELEVTLPLGYGARRCKAIRVGYRTVVTLDLGTGRRYEEDVLFERKVEIIGSTADGLELSEGSQRFQFTIIIPANSASHDWHTNGVISHILYAEIEGMPDPNERLARPSSSSSLFGLRRGSKQAGSRGGSRTSSPTRAQSSPPLSPPVEVVGSSTPPYGSPIGGSMAMCGANLADALSRLNTNGLNGGRSTNSFGAASRGASMAPWHSTSPQRGNSGASTPTGNGSANPAHVSAAQSLSITRQEAPPLPRAPSYDESAQEQEPKSSAWLTGTLQTKRNCMIVYNPNPSGGVNELSERQNGFVAGLGLWDMRIVSDVWTICALLSVKLKLSSLSAAATVFSIKLFLNQTHSIISPRDEDTDTHKHVSTRTFPILEKGKRPATGYDYPDKRHPALWRGIDARGGQNPSSGSGADEIIIDEKCRLPNDNVARPSTLPGVVTPISVSHSLVLEITFSIWGEDDVGRKMSSPGYGGLRVLRVSRPVTIPSCCLVPAVLDLPTYESHANDPLAPPPEQMPAGLPGWEWCACGWKIEELEARMRQSITAQLADTEAASETASRQSSTDGWSSGTSLATGSTRSAEDDKIWAERGRR